MRSIHKSVHRAHRFFPDVPMRAANVRDFARAGGLRGDRRLDDQLVDLGLDRVDRGLRLGYVGPRDTALFRRIAVDGGLIGKLRLVQAALRDLQRIRGLVEAGSAHCRLRPVPWCDHRFVVPASD